MGITVHYRGRLRDSSLIETFEDRIVEMAVEFGGHAQIWRSASDTNKDRIVRGVMLDLAPGVDSVSLLISPEGWLTPLQAIEDAEEGRMEEPPWVSVKTQFGPIEAHISLVEMLDTLSKDFLELEVHDEGEYWSTRDAAILRQKREFLEGAMKAFETALREDRTPLSSEARETPAIIADVAEKIAKRVHRTIYRPPEDPPVHFADDDDPQGNLERGS